MQTNGAGSIGTRGGITALAEGGHQCLTIKTDATVLAWGKNGQGQVGKGNTTTPQTDPSRWWV